MNKIRILISGCFLILIISTSAYAEINKNNIRTIDEKLEDAIDGIPYREMLYNKAFQTRFSLPPQGATKLDNGLLAIAFEVTVSSTGSHFLKCGLHLYVDSQQIKLLLNNPHNGVNPNSLKVQNDFFTNRYPLSNDDVTFKMAIASDFNSRLLIQSNSYPKGITSTESIQNYTINLYPGVSHLKFNPPCDALNFTNTEPSHLWLNKTNNLQNLPEGNRAGKPLSFYKFTLPISLSKSFSPIIVGLNKINQKNRERFSAQMRKYRKILNSEKGFTVP